MDKEEERISKIKAKTLYDTGDINKLEVGTFKGLSDIHAYLFEDLYDFAGKIRTVNMAKGNFRFAPVIHLGVALEQIDKMPQTTVKEIVEKYVEMNIAHPFREGNGRSTRIWLDLLLKKEVRKVVDWILIRREDYFSAIQRSPVNDLQLQQIIKNALIDDIDSRELYMKGIDISFEYEGLTRYKTENL